MGSTRRICALCGRMFVILIPPGDEETERDKLCPECPALPEPPTGPESPELT
jgi:hypothetical protein